MRNDNLSNLATIAIHFERRAWARTPRAAERMLAYVESQATRATETR